jgi:hypothetical protein
MAIVFGTITKNEVQEFLKLCKSRDWLVVKNTPTEIRYLDRNMNGHTIHIDPKAETSNLFIV